MSRDKFAHAKLEAAGAGDLERLCGEIDMHGKRVLDFGCGYGGKTVVYASRASEVAGVEPFEHMIAEARDYADSMGCTNVRFETCSQDDIPFEDESFDLILSHDVLEHVDDPSVSLREIARVLKPGGKAHIVFPPYDGAMSHHLDYVTRAPGLHWFFGAETLVSAVNRILTGPKAARFNTKAQPSPKLDWTKRRKVLPQLNGLGTAEFENLAAQHFEIVKIERRLLGHSRSSAVHRLVHLASRAASGLGLADHVTGSVIAELKKPQRSALHVRSQ